MFDPSMPADLRSLPQDVRRRLILEAERQPPGVPARLRWSRAEAALAVRRVAADDDDGFPILHVLVGNDLYEAARRRAVSRE